MVIRIPEIQGVTRPRPRRHRINLHRSQGSRAPRRPTKAARPLTIRRPSLNTNLNISSISIRPSMRRTARRRPTSRTTLPTAPPQPATKRRPPRASPLRQASPSSTASKATMWPRLRQASRHIAQPAASLTNQATAPRRRHTLPTASRSTPSLLTAARRPRILRRSRRTAAAPLQATPPTRPSPSMPRVVPAARRRRRTMSTAGDRAAANITRGLATSSRPGRASGGRRRIAGGSGRGLVRCSMRGLRWYTRGSCLIRSGTCWRLCSRGLIRWCGLCSNDGSSATGR